MKNKPSRDARRLLAEIVAPVERYERQFGAVPSWVVDDVPPFRLVGLLDQCNRIGMPLAARDLVSGEYF